MGYSFDPDFLAAQRHLAHESIQETGFLPDNPFWNWVEARYDLSIAKFGDDEHFFRYHKKITPWLRIDLQNENKPLTPIIPICPPSQVCPPPINVIPEPTSLITFAAGVLLIYVAKNKFARK